MPDPEPVAKPPMLRRRHLSRWWLVAPLLLIGLGIALAITQPRGSTRGTTVGSSFVAGGGRAPGFSLSNLEEPTDHVSLAKYRGRPVVLNFWASWCVPCRKEMPLLEATYHRDSAGVVFVGIDTNDTRSAALAFARETGVSYPLASDPGGTAATNYGLFGLPTTVFIDRTGHIVGREVGELHGDTLSFGLARLEAASSRDRSH